MIRPLRDVGLKECGAWAWWQGLAVVGRESWTWPNAKPGIGALTKGMRAFSRDRLFFSHTAPSFHRWTGKGLSFDSVHNSTYVRKTRAERFYIREMYLM